MSSMLLLLTRTHPPPLRNFLNVVMVLLTAAVGLLLGMGRRLMLMWLAVLALVVGTWMASLCLLLPLPYRTPMIRSLLAPLAVLTRCVATPGLPLTRWACPPLGYALVASILADVGWVRGLTGVSVN